MKLLDTVRPFIVARLSVTQTDETQWFAVGFIWSFIPFTKLLVVTYLAYFKIKVIEEKKNV